MKRDCTTFTAINRQQAYLATFRVRPLQTSVTPVQADPPASAPRNVGAALPPAQPLPPPSVPNPERANTPPLMAPRTTADQPTSQPPAGQLQQPHQPPSRKRPWASLESPDEATLFPSEPPPPAHPSHPPRPPSHPPSPHQRTAAVRLGRPLRLWRRTRSGLTTCVPHRAPLAGRPEFSGAGGCLPV